MVSATALRRRGRPRGAFLQDPDRYLLAVATVFRELGTSCSGAIEIAVAAIEGHVVGDNLKPGWGHGLNLLYAEFAMRPRRGAASTIDSRARELRRKMKRAVKDPAAARWLAAMSEAVLLALWAHAPSQASGMTAGAAILELGAIVGKSEFAHEVLLALWRSESMRRLDIICGVLPESHKLPPS